MPEPSSLPAPRHHATKRAWEWFESAEGQAKPLNVRKAIREALEEIDATFIAWDAERSAPKGRHVEAKHV